MVIVPGHLRDVDWALGESADGELCHYAEIVGTSTQREVQTWIRDLRSGNDRAVGQDDLSRSQRLLIQDQRHGFSTHLILVDVVQCPSIFVGEWIGSTT